jgi:hypothetical protein
MQAMAVGGAMVDAEMLTNMVLKCEKLKEVIILCSPSTVGLLLYAHRH